MHFTALSRNISKCPVWTHKQKNEIRAELQIVEDEGEASIDLNASNFNAAFEWCETPQGSRYWSDLEDEMQAARHSGQMPTYI